MRKNGIKDFKWIFYRQNLRKLVKIGFLALVGFFFQKKWGTNKIKSVSTYPWNVKWILLFSNFDFHILSPPPNYNMKILSSYFQTLQYYKLQQEFFSSKLIEFPPYNITPYTIKFFYFTQYYFWQSYNITDYSQNF